MTTSISRLNQKEETRKNDIRVRLIVCFSLEGSFETRGSLVL